MPLHGDETFFLEADIISRGLYLQNTGNDYDRLHFKSSIGVESADPWRTTEPSRMELIYWHRTSTCSVSLRTYAESTTHSSQRLSITKSRCSLVRRSFPP